jgi:2-polyprenyl-3-methyl-5-hydroxy-6-metoxy-1,4-benzoquinol methylase
MATNFESYSYYYNLLYKDKDYLGETLYIQDLFNRYKVKPKSILDLGCGTGNHSICLAQQGFYVHGVDLKQNNAS